MAHAEDSRSALKRRRSQSGSFFHSRNQPSEKPSANRDMQRCIDRINRLNALVSNGSDCEAELDEQTINDGNFDFPLLLAPGLANQSVQPTILEKISEMMQEMDPSRALFESGIQETLPKAQTSTRLPPYEETRKLINGYLQHLNCIFPIFKDNWLRRLISRLYTEQSVLDPGSRAAGYAVIATAYKLQLWATANTDQVAAAWEYFNAAMRLLPEISVLGDNIESNLRNIQALTVMSIFLQGSMQFNDAPKLLSNAIRQASVFDLNHDSSFSGVCPVEVQRTRRVLYVLDKEFSLHSGLPPMTKTGSQAADLIHENKDTDNALEHFCTLAAIEEDIYEELYSGKAHERPGVDLLDASFELDRRLRAWANGLPRHIKSDDGFSQSTEAILLNLMFDNCLITIHRLPAITCPIRGLYSRHANTGSEIAHRIELAKRIRTEAALSCIRTVQNLQTGGLWPFWLLLPPTIVSLILLLTTILYDPEASFPSPIDSIDAGVRFIHSANDKACGEFGQMLRIAAGTASIARKLQEKNQNDLAARKVAKVALQNAIMELRRSMRPRNRRVGQPASPFGAESSHQTTSAGEIFEDELSKGPPLPYEYNFTESLGSFPGSESRILEREREG